MTERSMFWDGTVLGDCGPYDQSDMMDRCFRAIFNGTADRGVMKGWRDSLEVTGTGSTLTVAAGAAIVYGMFYENTAALTVTIAPPSSGNATYYIVVRRNWTAQTCRIGAITGALVQTVGAYWDVPLATAVITSEGNTTLTDTRDWVAFCSAWPAATVDTEDYEEGAVTADKVPDRSRWELKGAGQLEADATNPAAWVAGASYDFWEYVDAARTETWVYFLAPTGLVGNVDIYVWSVPDVNGAAGPAENCEWDYNVYYGSDGATLTAAAATVAVDQSLRINTTVYRDQLIAGLAVSEGHIISLNLERDGAADSYNSSMRLLGIEMYWTADS